MKVLKAAEMQPANLSRHIAQMLQQNRIADVVPIDLDGAANAARFLKQMKSS